MDQDQDQDQGWDLAAVVQSCATSSASVLSTLEGSENIPALMDLDEDGVCKPEMGGNERKVNLKANVGGTLSEASSAGPVASVGNVINVTASAGVTSISFDDGHREEPLMFGNLISFTTQPEDFDVLDTKRKNKNNKRVIEISEAELSNDGWAWRKYGQKPIRGSPFPRNYYRCSRTKECSARKLVERSAANTSNFIVTYFGDHRHPLPTHLSSLSHNTKGNKMSVATTDLSGQPPCSSSSPLSTSSFSPTTSLKEDEIEINDEDYDELSNNF